MHLGGEIPEPAELTPQATENVARAIKAKTQGIGPANDWLKEPTR